MLAACTPPEIPFSPCSIYSYETECPASVDSMDMVNLFCELHTSSQKFLYDHFSVT